MQENNFEEQVQRKMDEFIISPSRDVWENVSLLIEKRKKDWRLVYFFLSFFVVLSLFSVIWLNIKNKSPYVRPNEEMVSVNKKEKRVDSRVEDINKQRNVKPGNDAVPTESIDKVKTKGKTVLRFNEDKSTAVLPGNITGNNLTIVSANTRINKSKSRYRLESKTVVEIKPANPEDMVPGEPISSGLTNEENFKLNTGLPNYLSRLIIQNISINNSAYFKNMVRPEVTFNEKRIDLIAPLEITKMRGNKHFPWQFGVDFSLGMSATRNGYFGVIGNNGEEKNLDVTQSPATGGNNTGPGVTTSVSPVKINKAFIPGMYATKQLTNSLALKLGVNYKYYSTTMVLGARVDSFVSNANYTLSYYRSGNDSKYKNQYHLIELPVGILFRPGKNKNSLPLYVYTGISFSKLIKTSALQFEPSSGTYYRNDPLLSKTQIDLSVMLMVSLQRKTTSPLLFGPQLNYALTSMAATGLYSNRHYSFLGLHLQKRIF